MYLILSALAFAIFALNVILGAFAGHAFMSDVSEMLVLFCASALFVVAILKKEADRNKKSGG